MGKRLFLLVAFLGLCGCASSSTTASANGFAGHWSGVYDAKSTGTSGTFSMTVASDGTTSTTTADNKTGASGSGKGTMTNEGAIDVTVTYPNATTSHLTGTLAKTDATHIGGDVSEANATATVSFTVTLTKQ